MAPTTYRELPRATRRSLVWRALLRPLLSITVLVVLYYLLPMDAEMDTGTIALLVVGLLVLVGLVVWQTSAILRSPYPAVQAVQAVAIAVPLFLLLFASAYFAMARVDPSAFTETMTRTDALYFTITVFATVGFGDIAPVTELARVVTMVQMLGNLLVLGVLLRVVLGAVRIGRQRKADSTGAELPGPPPSAAGR